MLITKSPNIYDKGHSIGQFFSSPCNLFAFVPIPKCASTYVTKFLVEGLSWKISKEDDRIQDSLFRKLVILREPIDRWVSGMAQYLTTYHGDLPLQSRELTEFIFKRVDFDPHTTPQVNFIAGLDIDSTIFFRFDSQLEKNFRSYIHENTGKDYNLPVFRNDTPKSGHKPYIGQKLKVLLKSNDQWLQHVTDYYKKDIDLYNEVKFYGSG